MERVLAERIKDIVFDKLFQLERLLTEFESEVPRQGPTSFLSAVKIVVRITREYYETRIKEIAGIADEEKRAARLYITSRIVLQTIVFDIHEDLLPFLDPGTLKKIPTEILDATRFLAAKFEDTEEIEISLVPKWDYQFGIKAHYDLVDALIYGMRSGLPASSVRKIKGKMSANHIHNSFAFIGYPWTERESLLLPSLVAHEIGHLKEYRNDLRLKFLPKSLDGTLLDSLVQTLANERVLRDEEEQPTLSLFYSEKLIRQQVVEKCAAITENWVKEFVVDLLALHLLGPAYFFAFLEWAAIIGFESAGSPSHPSLNWRLKVMMEELRNMGYLSHAFRITKIRGLLEIWQKELSKKNLVPQDECSVIVYHTLEKHLPRIYEGIRRETGSFSYSSARYERSVPPIVRIIQKGILPVQHWDEKETTFGYFEIQDILNAGWQVYKVEMRSFCELFSAKGTNKEQNARQTLSHLILKAIESAQIGLKWTRKKELP